MKKTINEYPFVLKRQSRKGLAKILTSFLHAYRLKETLPAGSSAKKQIKVLLINEAIHEKEQI